MSRARLGNSPMMANSPVPMPNEPIAKARMASLVVLPPKPETGEAVVMVGSGHESGRQPQRAGHRKAM